MISANAIAILFALFGKDGERKYISIQTEFRPINQIETEYEAINQDAPMKIGLRFHPTGALSIDALFGFSNSSGNDYDSSKNTEKNSGHSLASSTIGLEYKIDEINRSVFSYFIRGDITVKGMSVKSEACGGKCDISYTNIIPSIATGFAYNFIISENVDVYLLTGFKMTFVPNSKYATKQGSNYIAAEKEDNHTNYGYSGLAIGARYSF